MKLFKKENKHIFSLLLLLVLFLLCLICEVINSEKISSSIKKSYRLKFQKKLLTNRKSLTKAGTPKFIVYRDNYYNFCTRLSDAGFIIKDECSTTYIEDNFHFPCDADTAKVLDNSNLKYSLLKTKDNLPTATLQEMLSKSTCDNQKSFFDSVYKDLSNKLFAQNDMLFQVSIALLRDYEGLDRKTKFFENSKEVLVFNPVGKAIGLNFILRQLNNSFKLLNKSRFLKNPIKLLDETKDLKMEKAALYVTSFIELIDAYHQLVYICAKDSYGRALHFLVDRGARKFSESITLKTRVRINLYHISSKCGNPSDMPDDPQFNFNYKVLRQGVNQYLNIDELDKYLDNESRKEIFKPKDPIGKDVEKEFSSFSKFVIAVQRYAIRYENYNFLDNCQHFATGFYNIITNSEIIYLNKDWMGRVPFFDVSKDPFIIFFNNLSDQEFLERAKMLQDLNQRRKIRKYKKLKK